MQAFSSGCTGSTVGVTYLSHSLIDQLLGAGIIGVVCSRSGSTAHLYTVPSNQLDIRYIWLDTVAKYTSREQPFAGVFAALTRSAPNDDGAVKCVLLLLKAAVGFSWFEEVYKWPHCFISRRLAFVKGGNSGIEGADGTERNGGTACTENPHGSVMVYMGDNEQKFFDVCGKMGHVPGGNSWSLK